MPVQLAAYRHGVSASSDSDPKGSVMKPLIVRGEYFVPFAAVFLWVFVAELALIRRLWNLPSKAKQYDRGSTRILIVGNQLSLGVGFALAFEIPQAGISAHRHLLYFCGLALMLAGSALRRYCVHLLGNRFTVWVMVHPDQLLVTRGAYRHIRHPSYTAAMMVFLGVALCLTNWLTLVVVSVITVLSYVYRARVEEQALLEVLGDRYIDYMRRTKRFVPFIV